MKAAARVEPSSAALPAKLYFRIGEVAGLVGVEPHVLRYWEREFRAIRPSKSARGQRVYSRRDVENLMRVRELLYKEGFTIAGAKKKLHHPGSRSLPNHSVESHDAESFLDAGDNTARACVPPLGPPCAVPSKAREQLVAIRDEIEAFLAQLDPLHGARE